MNDKSKFVIISVLCTVLMCGVVLLAVMYAEGIYDLSFVNRIVTEPVRETEVPEESTPTTETPETLPPETDAPVQTPEADDYFSQGYHPTDAIYDRDSHVIAKLPLSLPTQYVSGTRKQLVFDVTYDERNIGRTYTENTEQVDRRCVELYMGLVVVHNEGAYTVYDSTGRKLLDSYGGTMPDFVYQRDTDGNPVFELEGEYYIISAGAFVPSDYTDDMSRGVSMNYGSFFGETQGEPVAYRKSGLWGYKNADGKVIITAKYKRAYNFSEGLGLVIDEDDSAYFINEDGKKVVSGYFPLGDTTMRGLGSIYFDGGCVMARNIVLGKKDVVQVDRDVLINDSGDIVTLPVGCTPVSYSNQRVLVQKDGKFGFYAVKGAWIADTIYDYATPFCEGLAVLGDSNGKKGVCDKDGHIIIPFIYTDISVCCDGVFVCYNPSSGWEVFIKLTK